MPTNNDPQCVRVKREAQEELDRRTEGMNPRQRDAFINQLAEELATRLGFNQVSRPIARGPDISAADARKTG